MSSPLPSVLYYVKKIYARIAVKGCIACGQCKGSAYVFYCFVRYKMPNL